MLNGIIDLRSDTVTHPTHKMREAMAVAPVGDDVYGDDPTVNRLEELAAQKLGKEAALFVPSGTMGNQLALFTHCTRGDEVIVPETCHIIVHEAGAAAVIAGVQARCLPVPGGRYDLGQLESVIRKNPDDIHSPRTALICLENADGMGRVLPLEHMSDVRRIADRYGVKVHLDGARVFNAAAALGVDARQIAQYADSVQFCISKGLCAPVGGLLAGTKQFVAGARRKRKILGGGMRQAGILAAAGIIALEEMTQRLGEDHENAKYMAAKLAQLPGVDVDPAGVQIGMVFFRLACGKNDADITAQMREHGVLINGVEDGYYRFVTHYYVDKSDIDKAVGAFAKITAD